MDLGKRRRVRFGRAGDVPRDRTPEPALLDEAQAPLECWTEPEPCLSSADVSASEGWFGDHSPVVFRPQVDVVDEGQQLRITAELPGMLGEEIQVAVGEQSLIIEGVKRVDSAAREEGCLRAERACGAFRRVIPFPLEIEPEAAEATYERGVLSVCIPKREGKPRPTRLHLVS